MRSAGACLAGAVTRAPSPERLHDATCARPRLTRCVPCQNLDCARPFLMIDGECYGCRVLRRVTCAFDRRFANSQANTICVHEHSQGRHAIRYAIAWNGFECASTWHCCLASRAPFCEGLLLPARLAASRWLGRQLYLRTPPSSSHFKVRDAAATWARTRRASCPATSLTTLLMACHTQVARSVAYSTADL